MFDRWEVTVDAGTTEADAERVECKISPGILTDLTVYAPPGCKGYLRCRVALGEQPLAPRSTGRYLAGEGILCDLKDMNEPITPHLPVLNWQVWNVDATYDHTPWLSAKWLTEVEIYQKRTFLAVNDLNRRLSLLFGV